MKIQRFGMFLLAALVAGALKHPALAADQGSISYKTYRNDKYGFEFHYPADMEQTDTSDNEVFVEYAPNGEGKSPTARSSIRIQPRSSGMECIAGNPGQDKSQLKQIVNAPQINTFYVGIENTTFCGKDEICSKDQEFIVSHKGNCFRIWQGEDFSNSDEPSKHDANFHYAKMKEIVKSFRFLDGESNEIVSYQQNPSFDCTDVKAAGVEEFVCKDPLLAEKDREMAGLYRKLMSTLPGNLKDKYRERQMRWIEEREGKFKEGVIHLGNDEAIRDSILYLYKARIARLKLYLEWAMSRKDEPGLKFYRNDEMGFEFSYPEDMHIVSSSTPVQRISVEYMSNQFHQRPGVSLAIHTNPGQNDEDCVCFQRDRQNKCPDYLLSGFRKNQKLNGFYMDTETGEPASLGGGGFSWQDFTTFHAGKCFRMNRMKWWQHWAQDTDEATQHMWADIEEHYDETLDIVKSFRFLDSEPKENP